MITDPREWGTPRSDVQRVAVHHGISESEAARWLEIYPKETLLPERGTGLAMGNEVPECPNCWLFLITGLVSGGALGVYFALILQKGR